MIDTGGRFLGVYLSASVMHVRGRTSARPIGCPVTSCRVTGIHVLARLQAAARALRVSGWRGADCLVSNAEAVSMGLIKVWELLCAKLLKGH